MPKTNHNLIAAMAFVLHFLLPEPAATLVVVAIAICWVREAITKRGIGGFNCKNFKNQELLAALFFICLVVDSGQLTSALRMLNCFTWLLPTVFVSLLFSCIMPASAVVFLQTRKSSAVRLNKVPPFLVHYPYVSCYLGLVTFLALISSLPNSIGSGLYHHLFGVLDDVIQGPYVHVQSPFVYLPGYGIALNCLVFAGLLTILHQPIVRISAAYEAFLTRLFIFKDSLFDSFHNLMQVKATKLFLPGKHSHLQAATETLCWVSFIYVAIFSVILFSPGELGQLIKGSLQECLDDALCDVKLAEHHNLLLFMAAVIASYCTVPLAVSCRSLLPARKQRYLMFSKQAIFAPYSFKTLFGFPPIYFWSDLERVSLSQISDNKSTRVESLTLSFKDSIELNIRTDQMNKEALVDFLCATDEYSASCLIEPCVVQFREALLEQTKQQTFTESKRFASTIFSLRKAGETIGTYRIVRKLAAKSLAATYLARDAQNRLVVIKEFLVPDDSNVCERSTIIFDRECALLKQLDHPSIAKIVDTFEEGFAKYLVIEHIAGTDLRELVARIGARNEKTVKAWALELADILHYLHTQESVILHRDLTPDNIMLSDDGSLRLIDFGASHILIEGVTGTLVGKQCYIAPEQLRGKAVIESDIYSFGCTLYFLLTGLDPRALQQSDLYENEVHASQVMRDLIFCCTDFEPANRIHSFQQIVILLSEKSESSPFLPKEGSMNLIEASYGL